MRKFLYNIHCLDSALSRYSDGEMKCIHLHKLTDICLGFWTCFSIIGVVDGQLTRGECGFCVEGWK